MTWLKKKSPQTFYKFSQRGAPTCRGQCTLTLLFFASAQNHFEDYFFHPMFVSWNERKREKKSKLVSTRL